MKTLQQIRDDIHKTQPSDTDAILNTMLEIVLNLQRIERELNTTRRIADNASWGPRKIGCE